MTQPETIPEPLPVPESDNDRPQTGRPTPCHGGRIWLAVASIFLVSLLCRCSIFFTEHREGDEIIYRALVEQLDTGRGYTLQGHRILDPPNSPREQYGQALFYHPPGGIVWFWLFHRLFGSYGYPLVQLVTFAVFFAAMLLLAAEVLRPLSGRDALVVAGLSGFTPIMVLVTSRFWLDGPLLAFSTLAAALFLHGVRRRSPLIVVLAGIVLGYASWVKVTAFLVVPGVLLLGWVATAKNARSALFRHAILFVAIASFIQVWWPVWQWRVLGSPFPSWAGRPVQQLIEASPYMHFIAVERSPWIYLYLLPFILWTWVPSLVLLAAQWPNPAVRQKGLVLASWTVGILGIHIWLALTGYARLLRYVILVTPATILLFALVASTVWDAHVKRPGARGGANASWVLLLLAAAGLVLEIAQGVQVFFFNHGRDLVGPLIRW